jgi:hypothetical protein
MKHGLAHLHENFVYADYVRRLDAQAVLDHYGALNQRTELNKDGSTEVVHSCLLDRVERHHRNGDQNPSAACNLDKKLYACYVWWSGDLLHLIQKLEGKESLDAALPVAGEFLSGAVTEDALRARLEAVPGGAYSAAIPKYSERVLAPWAFVHPYLAERGIDGDTASRLHVGFDEQTNRITIPHFWGGNLVGWQARAIPDRPGQWPGTVPAVPKYRSNPGFPKSETLYGYDDAVASGFDRVVVVESPFSVIRASALGVRGVVATFGAQVSSQQVALLREFRRVYVWMDDDDAGRIAERKVLHGLHQYTDVAVVTPDVGRDLGDCRTAQEVGLKLSEAEPATVALHRIGKEWRRN